MFIIYFNKFQSRIKYSLNYFCIASKSKPFTTDDTEKLCFYNIVKYLEI